MKFSSLSLVPQPLAFHKWRLFVHIYPVLFMRPETLLPSMYLTKYVPMGKGLLKYIFFK